MKYWLQRISHEREISYVLLDKGYLSIGWSGLAQSGIEQTKNITDFETTLQKHGYERSRNRWSLWNFFQFRPNDCVVIPLLQGKFSIAKVKGSPIPITQLASCSGIQRDKDNMLCRVDGKTADIGFVLPIELIKQNLSRYEYADNKLTSRMKIRQTNADISDLAERIQNVLQADTPINLYAVITEQLAERLLSVMKAQLTPHKFELLIKWYFQKLGASEAYCPAANSPDKYDGADADVIAEFDALGVRFYVQAKLHDNMTSQWAVQQITAYKQQHQEEYTVIPWVISTADTFSAQAAALAQENHVRLIAGTEFARMLLDAGITDINKAFE